MKPLDSKLTLSAFVVLCGRQPVRYSASRFPLDTLTNATTFLVAPALMQPSLEYLRAIGSEVTRGTSRRRDSRLLEIG